MVRILLYFYPFLFCCSAFAQKTVAPRFDNEDQLQELINTRILQRQQIDILAPFNQADLSENTLMQLYLAVSKVLGEKKPVMEAEMVRIEKYRDLSGVDKEAVLRLEKVYLELDREITRLRSLSGLLYDPITEDPLVRQEIDFYRLSPKGRIAEIGAGSPAFAKQLINTCSPKTYYLNDIDTLAVQLMADYSHFQTGKTDLIPLLGASQNTQLEGKNLDVILIRNSVHHFEYLPEMLSSIQKSLSSDGRLLIKETFVGTCYGLCCPDLIVHQDFMKALELAQFSLVRQSTLIDETATWHLFEFKANPKEQP